MDEKSFYIHVGLKIREFRKEMKIDQETFSKFMKLTRASVVNIEKGRQRISAYDLVRLTIYFKKPLKEFLPQNDNPFEGVRIIGINKEDQNYQSDLLDIKRFLETL